MKRMKRMDEARVLRSTQPPKLVFLSLIFQLISNGSWVNDWVSIWVQIGGQNGQKKQQKRVWTVAVHAGTVLQFLKVLGWFL